MSTARVVVIGAGWYGLAAAKTYLEVNPAASLTIVDDSGNVGGVWSAPRLYPGIIADSPVGAFDYSDPDMTELLGLKLWDDIPAERVAEYMERYAEKFDLRQRCKLSTKVLQATRGKITREWILDLQKVGCEGDDGKEVLVCDKLIVATGMFSRPIFPDLNMSTFKGPVMHSQEMGLKHQRLLDEKCNRVTVVGGNKSAVDAVSLCASNGKPVDWVIREGGNGATMLFEVRRRGIHGVTLANGRWSSIPSPSLLAADSFWYRFFHSGKNRFGFWLMKNYWKNASKAAFADVDKWGENRKKLTPNSRNVFWTTVAISALHSPKFMQMVDEGKFVHIHRASITKLESNSVALSNGNSLPSDAIVFATGWERSQPRIFPTSDLADLGIPVPLDQQLPEFEKHWNSLDQAADNKVCQMFPFLANPPPETKHGIETATPYRLFRFMVPPALAAANDRSIVFLGVPSNIRNPSYAEIQSLWVTAYLSDLLPSPINSALSNRDAMEKDVAEISAWNRRRYTEKARRVPVGGLEIQDFMDRMMNDLGLDPERKRNQGSKGLFGVRAWAREWFLPYKGTDYRGIVAEFMAKTGQR